jgi:hypothetical protein
MASLQPRPKSGHDGVHWDKRYKKWVVRMRVDGEGKWFGQFRGKEDALKRRREVEAMRPPRRPIVVQPDDQSIKFLPLTQGKIAIIDASRWEWASQWNWYAGHSRKSCSYYAVRWGRRGERKQVFLHRQILGEPEAQVDHINGNTLDNRVANLRPCTHAENTRNHRLTRANTSGYSGVTRSGKKWEAAIGLGGKWTYLGRFATKELAIAARQAAEAKYHGEFAYSRREHQPPKKPPVADGAAYQMSLFS